ncbi:MAG TPA: GNAT family N-acetyltransferase [Pyrinomonadaceae bacterium]|nr:GNAT family N-acetyltransferase [Pyrinomonadaceae bacterium]
MTDQDWDSVCSIYRDGVSTGLATFETQLPSWTEWSGSHLPAPRLVATDGEQVVGWAALGPVSSRSVYAGVAEVSVYVARDRRGGGIGKGLLGRLVAESEKTMIWTLQASVFPENAASIAIHKSCGFREVGRRERIGNLSGTWRDTILLERRSKLVGSD